MEQPGRTLLPADAQLAALGGPEKEFWAAGRNWNILAKGLKPENLAMMGQWRVEVSPGSPRRDDVFLHVIQVGPKTLGAIYWSRLTGFVAVVLPPLIVVLLPLVWLSEKLTRFMKR